MSLWNLHCVLILCWWALPTIHALECGRCDRHREPITLTCPRSFDFQYIVYINDFQGSAQNHLRFKCKSTIQTIDFSFVADCNFNATEYVVFENCPLPNGTFSDTFEKLGIIPEKIKVLTFNNARQRRDELHERYLEGLTNLVVLTFEKNVFTSIPETFFDNTPNLRHLTLTENNMETLPESLFANTPNLTKIELRNNELLYLPINIFANLSNLRNISLFRNNLNQLQRELISNVPELLSLELTGNNISRLDPNVFADVKGLRKLLLGTNKLETVPEDLLHSCPLLETLILDENRIKVLPEDLLRESRMLKRLEFDYNEITQIPERLFATTLNLEILKFRRNRITTLPSRVFQGLRKLEVLDVQSNEIGALPHGIFDDLSRVDTLILYNNSLSELPDEIFKKCTSLAELYLHLNNLSVLLPSMFPKSSVITKLNLSYNNFSFSPSSIELPHGPRHITIQEYFPLSHLPSLVELYLGNNRITEMPQAFTSELKNLTILDLSNNLISYIDHSDLFFKSDKVKIDLSNNQIRVFSLNNIFFPSSRKIVEIMLRGNPFICNCELYTFARILQQKIDLSSTNDFEMDVVDEEEVICSYPEKPHANSLVKSVDTKALTCKLDECPSNCTCSTRTYDSMFILDCSYLGIRSIPMLNSDYIPDDKNYSLTVVLRNNSIKSLKGLQEEAYGSLVNLSLSNNNLDSINETYLPEMLEALDISGNNISTLPSSMLEFLNSTDMVLNLANNPLTCDCSILGLHSFLRDPDREIADIHNVKCDAFNNEPLINLTEEELCPLIQQPLVIVSIASIAVFLLLFAILGTVSFYKYKQDIKVWLFTHRLCLWAVAEEEKDADKKYDAFISYSNKDEEFVNNVLVPGLESGEPKYKVCLHYRDWVPGEYIQTQIDQSVEASRRTIVVLSSNFIENVWGHIEFKTAHSKALKDRTNRIIVIVLGEVPPDDELDEELKLYLSTRTYLQWRDVKFWEKLRYAMPHPPDLIRKRNKKHKKTEKLEMSRTHIKSST